MGAPSPPTAPAGPLFDYYAVLAMEATCERDVRIDNQEVIELATVLVDAHTNAPVAEFQRYVRPVCNPALTPFCVELTGIAQATVDAARPFDTVYAEYLEWLASAGVGPAAPAKSVAFVTGGDWDLKKMLRRQLTVAPDAAAQHEASPLRPLLERWVNVRTAFMRHCHRRAHDLAPMFRHFGLEPRGRPHSAVDVCRNTARCLRGLLAAGFRVDYTQGPPDVAYWAGAPCPPPSSVLDTPCPAWAAEAAAAPPPTIVPAPTPAAMAAAGDDVDSDDLDAPRPALPTAATPGPYLSFTTDRDPGADILATHRLRPSIRPEELRAVAKKMGWVLRHGALEAGVAISLNGFIRLDELLRCRRLNQVSPAMVAAVVRDQYKARFRLVYGREDGRVYVRANHGHSMAGLEMDLVALTADTLPVPVAVHGTDVKSWNSIRNDGLSRMSRHHVHLAKGLPGDRLVPYFERTPGKILVSVDLRALLADGIPVFESEHAIMTPGLDGVIALRYFTRVVVSCGGEQLYPPPEPSAEAAAPSPPPAAAGTECDTPDQPVAAE